MGPLRWTDPDWLSSAHRWIATQLDTHGYDADGPATQPHIRPWSTAMRIPTTAGPVWFKAGTQALAHEASLTSFLATLLPEHSPRIIAVEPDQGWLLMEDLGEKLRALINAVADLRWWHQVVGIYADLQQLAARRSDELIATGIPDNRPPALKRHWEELLADTDCLMVGTADGVSREQLRTARGLWPRIDELCEDAGRAGLPDTVVHEDLHDANVFVNGERIIVADWGDSCIANPLTTLTVLLRSAAYQRELEETAPEIVAIRDRYLACWGEHAPPEKLKRAAHAATRLGMLHRSLTWRKAIMSAPAEHTAQWADAVPGWLGEFLETFKD
jgi:aminoglycoside/choline kinase family phosphotransferase